VRNLYDTGHGKGSTHRGPHLSHAAPQRVHIESTFVHHSLTLEALIAGKGDDRVCLLVPLFERRFLGPVSTARLCFGYTASA
jgi:hypothetical protein